MKTPKSARGIVSTKDILGVKVINPKKENLGEIQEIVIEKVSGKIRYLVLSFGGFLGMGDKLFAIPWNAVHYNPVEDAFSLNMTKDKLNQAPGFDKNQPPDYSDQLWGEDIYKYYETTPYWKE